MEIIVNKVSYTYDEGMAYEKHALVGIDLKISQGDFIGLIGRTGSGKSTLIRMFNGLLKPSYGGVFVDGEDIHDKGYPISRLRGRIGMVFQYPEHQLFENTVLEDVEFGPKNQGIDPLQVELRSFEALKSVGIGQDLLDVSPFSLSGGQKRRVAIAGVLAMQPEVLILDEPTAGLDPEGAAELLIRIKELNEEQNITVILISHNMEQVAAFADRVWVMNEGRIWKEGSVKDVFSDVAALESAGLRTTTSAYLARELKKKGMPLPEGLITRQELVQAIAGIRRK